MRPHNDRTARTARPLPPAQPHHARADRPGAGVRGLQCLPLVGHPGRVPEPGRVRPLERDAGVLPGLRVLPGVDPLRDPVAADGRRGSARRRHAAMDRVGVAEATVIGGTVLCCNPLMFPWISGEGDFTPAVILLIGSAGGIMVLRMWRREKVLLGEQPAPAREVASSSTRRKVAAVATSSVLLAARRHHRVPAARGEGRIPQRGRPGRSWRRSGAKGSLPKAGRWTRTARSCSPTSATGSCGSTRRPARRRSSASRAGGPTA